MRSTALGLLAARLLPAERAALDNLKGTRYRVVDCSDDCWKVSLDDRQLNSRQRHNSQTPAGKVLLLVQGLIAGQKHVDALSSATPSNSPLLKPAQPI